MRVTGRYAHDVDAAFWSYAKEVPSLEIYNDLFFIDAEPAAMPIVHWLVCPLWINCHWVLVSS